MMTMNNTRVSQLNAAAGGSVPEVPEVSAQADSGFDCSPDPEPLPASSRGSSGRVANDAWEDGGNDNLLLISCRNLKTGMIRNSKIRI